MARSDEQPILVISGPSGVGKTSVARALAERDGRFELAVTSTTRAMRPGEVDGRDYRFLSDGEFQRRLDGDGFIEHVSARGARYGLTKDELERIWDGGRIPVLVLDPAGKDAVKALFPQALSIFVDAPAEVVEARLAARGDTDVASRMEDNLKVWAERDGYDAVADNSGSLEVCVDEVEYAFNNHYNEASYQDSIVERKDETMAEYDDRIPERLQLLRVGLGGADDLGVFAYYIDTQQTNWSVPSFCLGPSDENPEFMDVQGTIEETLHDLLDNGGTPDDVRKIMGLVQESELDGDALESDAYTPIDLGWCIEGNLLDFERVPPESSDVHDILSDEQIAHIEDWFDVMPADERLNKAEQVAHDHAEAGGEPVKRPADLLVGRWRVHLVHEGDHWGLNGCNTYGDDRETVAPYRRFNDCQKYGHGLPLVEFYDMAHAPSRFPEGQFVSRYYMSTLLGIDKYSTGDIRDDATRGLSLSLDGGVPAWTVRADDLKVVGDYLHGVLDAYQAEGTPRGDERASLADVAKESHEASETLSAHGGHDGHEIDER